MTSASLDRLLGAILAIAGATGLLTITAGTSDSTWLFVVHGIAGAVLFAAVLLKLARSVPPAIRARRAGRLALGAILAFVVLGSAGAALAQAVLPEIVVIGPWTLISWHAYGGLLLAVVLLVHLLPRRWRLLTPRPPGLTPRPPGSRRIGRPVSRPLSRRAVLEGASVLAAGAGLWSVAQLSDRLAGSGRRFTGSRAILAAAPPSTTFFGEPEPAIDLAEWRLRVVGAVSSPLELSAADLRDWPLTTTRAVLDCTSGWSADCTWTGVSLDALLAAAGASPDASDLDIRAVTGWSTVLPIRDARTSLLATHVGGAPLAGANGAPARLVVPARRGLEWVKWVERIEVR